MTEHSVTHASFTLRRDYAASPERVFRAFADPAAKAQWFAGPDDWEQAEVSMDFRVGGREVNGGGPAGGPVSRYEALYQDIVPNERIISTYDMYLDGNRISVSLASIELEPNGSGTTLTLTEHGVYLDGYDTAVSREHGTGELLNALGAALDRESANA
jgi:uncharacterized protein YndB with AHSA1/START domain